MKVCLIRIWNLLNCNVIILPLATLLPFWPINNNKVSIDDDESTTPETFGKIIRNVIFLVRVVSSPVILASICEQ